MTKKHLRLGEGVVLPAEDFIESATAVLAKRGSGKSGGIKVIMEEVLDAGLRFVALDPVGVMWGIISSFDGSKPSGYNVLVIGGPNGHIPLNKDAGHVAAKAIAASAESVIIDFRGTSKTTYRRFVTDFLTTLRESNQLPRLVILGEATQLIPQKIRPEMAECYGAVIDTILLGRNSALGILIEAQRPAVVNKDALAQMDTVVCMNINHPLDKKAMREWFDEAAEEDPEAFDQFWAGVSRLQPREGIIWSPSLLNLFKEFKFRDFRTFHPDRTHLRRKGLLAVKPAVADVTALADRLRGDLAALVEKAKTDDPATLKAKVKALEAQVVKLEKTKPAERVERVEVPALSKDERTMVQCLLTLLDRDKTETVNITRERIAQLDCISSRLEGTLRDRPAPPQIARPRRPNPVNRTNGSIPQPTATAAQAAIVDLAPAKHRILEALGKLEALGVDQAPKNQVAALSGASPKSSAYANSLGSLRTAGLIEYPAQGMIALTENAREAIGVQAPPTDAEMHEQVRQLVTPAQWRIIDALIREYPSSLPKEDLAGVAGASVSSSAFANNLGALRSLGFIDYPQQGHVAATRLLFPEGPEA